MKDDVDTDKSEAERLREALGEAADLIDGVIENAERIKRRILRNLGKLEPL